MGESWAFDGGDQIVEGLVAERLLGGGRRFEAYLAFDESRFCPVVVKLVRPSRGSREADVRALAREAEMLGMLAHPVIVRLLDSDLDGDRPLLVLEHVEGPRLSTLLRRYGRLPVEQIAPLGLQLASALAYMHGRDMVHLDLKPKNVIMAGPPRLIDFSIAISLERASRLTRATGTRTYMAPEQTDPGTRGPVGAAADVWGLGTVLFEAVAGWPAFPRSDDRPYPQVAGAPAGLPSEVPIPLVRIIRGCLEPDAKSRPTSEELVAEMDEIMAALPQRYVLSNLRPGLR